MGGLVPLSCLGRFVASVIRSVSDPPPARPPALIYPSTHQIYLEGEVSREWNGQSTTSFVSEAPFQAEVDTARVTVNATFVYCTQVREVVFVGGGGGKWWFYVVILR